MTYIVPGLVIWQVTEVSDDLYLACQRLIPQLTSKNPPPSRLELEQLISSKASILFAAQRPEVGPQVIGLATLVLYRVPTGFRAYIEDVIVDENVRGQRIGEALTRACL